MSQTEYRINIKIPLTTTKQRVIVSTVICVLLLLLHNICSFLTRPTPAVAWIGGNMLILVTWMLMTWKTKLSKKDANAVSVLLMLILPFIAMAMTEITVTRYPTYAFNPAIYYIAHVMLLAIPYAITGKVKYAVYIIHPIIWVLTAANYYVTSLRGTPLMPLDISAVETTTSVLSSYNFTPTYKLTLSLIFLVLSFAMAQHIHNEPKSKKAIIARICAALFSITIMCVYSFTPVLSAKLQPNFMNQSFSVSQYGVTANFLMNIKYSFPEKPDGYTTAKAEEILNNANKQTSANSKKPHVICIMNEAWSDLSIYEDSQTNKDPLAFYHSLTENTIKGNLYVPVFGNGTANSEMEFLTGYSTAYLPAGSYPYVTQIKGETPSLATIFKQAGYQTIALHQFSGKNYHRPQVYKDFGFDTFYGIEDMVSKEVIQAMNLGKSQSEIISILKQQYPNAEEYLTRYYLNDRFGYDFMIDQMNQASKNGNSLFAFNVTMQNHGGYAPSSTLQEEIYRIDENGDKGNSAPELNTYLSLVHESDKALQELIEYCQQQDEPIVIVMFGDHQPNVAQVLNDEHITQRNVTPFLIWANYDIPEAEIDMLSVNYLGSYLLQTIGMELPAYHQYLLELSKTLPVIIPQGCYDYTGRFYGIDNETYATTILQHKYVCYNFLLDKQRNNQFYLP